MSKKRRLFFLLAVMFISLQLQVQSTIAETNGSIGLKENNTPDTAVDPERNEEIESKKIPTEGPYSLSYVSDLDFGKHELPKEEMNYFAKNDVVTMKESQKKQEVQNFIQISDTSGSESGWKLFVSSSNELVNEKAKIKGVSYSFNNIVIRPIKSDGNEFQKTDKLYTPGKSVKVLSDSNQQTLIAESKGIEGQGRWHVLFGNNLTEGKQSIAMTVPKGTVTSEGVYHSNLVWDFTNAK